MLIAGCVCLVLAAIAAYIFFNERKTLQAAVGTETLQCGEVNELSKAAAAAVGAGSFSHACEVLGPAKPPETGVLKASESGQECVWYRSKLTEHYWDWERDSDGDMDRTRKTREIHSSESETPFFVDDGTGRIEIVPVGADVDGPDKVVDRMEKDAGPSGWSGLASSVFGGDRTIGIEHEEWIIRPGARLYVLGEASDSSGQVRIGTAKDGPFVISTRSEEEFTSSTRTTMRIALAAAIVFGVAAPILIVLGLV